jgi:hypothetical protein
MLWGGNAWSAAEWRFAGADRVVAVADIHGAYDAFVRILLQSEVIDNELRWAGGTTHLVIVGDVLDRGPDSRQAMDLIMRLQTEASTAGGRVHLAVGNHELMVLTGDMRYVSAGEFAAFADEEPMPVREAAFDHFRSQSAESMDDAAARTNFDERFPLGFFAQRAAFAADGIYGAWLLEQPLLVVIDETAFVHGGLSDVVAELGGEGLNTQLGQQVRDYVDDLGTLIDNGVLHLTDDFYDHPDRIMEFAEQVELGITQWPDGLEATAARLAESNRGLVFNPDSPLWYRGSVGCSALTESDRLGTALAGLGVERVVIGHTPTPSARVLSRMEETVFRIDTGMLNDFYGGRAAALVIEAGNYSVTYEDSDELVSALPQPRRVGMRPANLTADEMEALLLNADIVSETRDTVRPDSTSISGRTPVANSNQVFVTLRSGDIEVQAVFVRAPRRGFLPEVAAYRIDRMLGLDMVPVTVPREVGGRLGSLQFAPSNVIDETERSTQGIGSGAWCPLRDQFQAMYVFDSLIYNEGRTPERIRYSTDNFQLILVGHDNALSTGRERPPHLAEIPLALGAEWTVKLGAMDEDGLTVALDDILDRRRIRALLQRRDALLGLD